MRLTIDLDSTVHEVDVTQMAQHATLDDLLYPVIGVRLADDERLWVDDHPATAADRICELTLLEGSRISRVARAVPTPAHGWSAMVAGGLDAGEVIEIPAGRALAIGRSPQADITVDSPSASWAHCTVEREGTGVRVRDVGSTNGTFVGGARIDTPEGMHLDEDATIRAGGTTILLRGDLAETAAPRPGTLPNVTASGTVPFNRPPRPGRPPEPDGVVPPERKDIPPVSKFNVLTIVGPLVMALVMVLIMKNIRYGAFAVLSPLLGLGTWFEQKRRRAKDLVEEDERFATALTTFHTDLERAAAIERARRHEVIPDPATMLRRSALPSTRLWQRRHGTEDFLRLHAGVGDVPWRPPIAGSDTHRMDDAVRGIVEDAVIPAAPIEVDLSAAGVVGIVGNRQGALALARSLLVQAGTHCGPADLSIGVYCDQGRRAEWEWTAWLPHTRRLGDSAGDRWVSADRARSDVQLRGLRDAIDAQPAPALLLVLDSEVLTEGREAPARMLLGHGRQMSTTSSKRAETQVSGIVIATAEEQLPASCTVVITVADDAAATIKQPGDLSSVDLTLGGISIASAHRAAMDLARFDDPELVIPGSALPSLVRFPPLLNVTEFTPEVIRDLWANSPGIFAPIGVGENGPFALDLVRDGPHGLVGGTTGSGKSEFLRSLVAGLAACNDPTTLSFILIDFKGGAAFTACERLPHTIGTVSNLDEQLADRAIRSLEAEMDRRQRAFAAAGEGVDNLKAYLATNPAEPMPRLLLVIDEFAMLAKDYPDVLTSLVSVGAVGRTLGVHMILATQRPAGVVNDDILANTNLRVALRVQSKDDSINVIGVPTAAAIGRNQQGRAFIKLGQDDITPVQTALVTGSAQQTESDPVELRPVVFGPPVQVKRSKKSGSKDTDLDLLIDAIVAANDAAGIAAPRKVWPEALGERVDLAGFGGEGGAQVDGSASPDPRLELEPSGPDEIPLVGAVTGASVRIGLADDPDRQRQISAGWDMDRGNLLLLGIPGSGTSTTLASIALTLAAARAPADLDILVLDMGSRDLAPLADLPHTIGYAGSGSASKEQQQRLLKFVRAELDRRRVEPGPHREMLVLIDGLAALKDEYQDFEGIALLDGLYRAYADGPDVGMHFAATSSRARAVASAIEEVTTQKWLFRLADPYDYSAAGIKPQQAPSPVPGRCVSAETKLQTHIATPACGLAAAIETVRMRWPGAEPKTSVVRQLPEHIAVHELRSPAVLSGEPWRIPVGLRESDLEPAMLELYENEHMLVAGPVRSGKSTTLLAIAQMLRMAGGDGVEIWGMCQRRSPLIGSPLLNRLAVGDNDATGLCGEVRNMTRPIVVLIDDAEQFNDSTHGISDMIGANLANLHIVAAGRSDDLRSNFSHWSKPIGKARCGLLLQPNLDFDGDLLGAALPRRISVNLTQGRGFACSGGITTMIQAVSPD